MEDSGGASRFRGGSGTCWEVEPLDSAMTLVTFGEDRRIPALGAAGAKSAMVAPKVGRLEVTRNGETQIIIENVIETIRPGECAANRNPGGGGYHGRYGFLTFSHAKAVYRQADASPVEALLRPPYGDPVREFLAGALKRPQ